MIGEVAAAIRRAPARLGATRLVLVDGPSGAGKTTFAEALAGRVGAEIVHTDDLLDGWEDQFTYWERLVRSVFEPIARGEAATYPIYDWHAGKFAGGVTVMPVKVLIVEGVGAAREEGRPLASLTVFVDAPLEARLARSLRRDGPLMQPKLELWRRREGLHFAADATAWCADVVIRGD